MKILTAVSMLIVATFVTSAAERFEITAQVGSQINGGYDLSTLFV